MNSLSKNFISEESIKLMVGEENETKKVRRSRERKQTELHPSQNSKKNKVQSFLKKGTKFSSLQEVLSVFMKSTNYSVI